MSRATKIRAPNKRQHFTTAEDIQLCRSWLETKLVPLESLAAFWKRVEDHYDENCPNGVPERNFNSLMQHWKIINNECNEFSHCIQEAQRDPAIQDVIEGAQELFRKRNYDTTFNMMECYDILKDEQKWQLKMRDSNLDTDAPTDKESRVPTVEVASNIKQEPVRSGEEILLEGPSVEANDDTADQDNTEHRGDGANREAANEGEGDDSDVELPDDEEEYKGIPDDYDASSNSGSQSDKEDEDDSFKKEMVAIEREKLKIKREMMEHEIMMVDVDSISNPSRHYYWETKQREIVQTYEKEELKLKRKFMDHETMMLDPDTISDPERRRYWKRKQRKIMRKK